MPDVFTICCNQVKSEYIIKVKHAVGCSDHLGVGEAVYLHIKNGYFSSIGNSIPDPDSQIQLIDESDKTALPGLIDMHVHLTRQEPGAGINLAPLYLAHGVTSVRDVGSDLQEIKRLRSRIESGELPGPHVYFCGPQLNGKCFRPGMCNLQTLEETLKTVRTLRDGGVHALKIYDQLLPDLAQTAIKEASQSDIPVCGHLGKTSAQEAIDFGISGIEHLTSLAFDLFAGEPRNPFSPDVFRRVAAVDFNGSAAHKLSDAAINSRVYIDPTLVVYDRILRFPELQRTALDMPALPKVLASYWRERMGKFTLGWQTDDYATGQKSFEKLKSWLSTIQRRGALICAGTDTPNPYLIPGQSLLDEIRLLADAGLSTRDAIGAATKVAAAALQKSDEIGTLESGKRADFLLVEGDPLKDISAIEKITAVFKNGVRYAPQDLERVATELSSVQENWQQTN